MRYVAQNGSRIVHVGHHLFQCLEHGFFVFGQRAAYGIEIGNVVAAENTGFGHFRMAQELVQFPDKSPGRQRRKGAIQHFVVQGEQIQE